MTRRRMQRNNSHKKTLFGIARTKLPVFHVNSKARFCLLLFYKISVAVSLSACSLAYCHAHCHVKATFRCLWDCSLRQVDIFKVTIIGTCEPCNRKDLYYVTEFVLHSCHNIDPLVQAATCTVYSAGSSMHKGVKGRTLCMMIFSPIEDAPLQIEKQRTHFLGFIARYEFLWWCDRLCYDVIANMLSMSMKRSLPWV